MKTYFIIHGSFGSSQENWFPWLEKELCEKDRVINLDFPIGEDKQNYRNWEMVLNSVKRFINKDSVFFCHSISCIFLVKFCVKNNINIGKAIMVSGFNNYLGLNNDYDAVNCTMYLNNASDFVKLCKKRVHIHSLNDPYVTQEKLNEFTKLIDAQEIVIEQGGHLNAEAGYKKFPKLLELI